ncbi:MAG: hypothetical protein MSA89_14315 [Clostridium sp.]|nr:hypothetical protein [Clostridium sp.]MCI7444231.1 hypothetical protein [Clostridium sp.]
MLWKDVRKSYPNKWVVFESLKQHEENNNLIVEDVAIIEVFDDINDAFKCYRMLHRNDKNRELGFGNTKEEILTYEIKKVGLMR